MNDFNKGDLVRYIPSDSLWTVDEFVPATAYRGAQVYLGKSSSEDGDGVRVTRASVLTAPVSDVELVTAATERSIGSSVRIGDEIFTYDKGGDFIGSVTVTWEGAA